MLLQISLFLLCAILLLLYFKGKQLLKKVNASLLSPFTPNGRKLAAGESFFCLNQNNEMFFTHVFKVKFSAIHSSPATSIHKRKITKELLHQALERVVERHPLLQMTISISGAEIFFERLQNWQQRLPLHVTVAKDTEAECQRIITEEVDHGKVFEGLQFRLHVILPEAVEVKETADLIFASNHAIDDRMSFLSFINDFMKACALEDGSIQESKESLHLPPLPLLHSSSHIANVQFGWKELFDILGKLFIKTQPPVPNPDRATASANRKTNYSLIKLTAEETAKFIKVCKANGTTVFAEILAAAAKAMDPVYRSAGAPSSRKYVITGLISPRAKLGVSNEQIGCFISSASFNYSSKEIQHQDTHELARGIKTSLVEQVSTMATVNHILPFYASMLPPNIWFKVSDSKTQGRLADLSHSSGGVYPYPTKIGSFCLDELYAMVGTKHFGSSFWFASQTVGDHLMITFESLFPMVTKEEHEQVLNKLLTQLQQ